MDDDTIVDSGAKLGDSVFRKREPSPRNVPASYGASLGLLIQRVTLGLAHVGAHLGPEVCRLLYAADGGMAVKSSPQEAEMANELIVFPAGWAPCEV